MNDMPEVPEFLRRESEPMACRGTLISLKHMKTTGALRVEVEIEKEFVNDAFEKLGRFPDPATARHIALAVIKS